MTTEIRYIIENRKFKRTWDDYLTYWEFLIPLLMVVFGLSFLVEGEQLKNYLIGVLLVGLALPLPKFTLMRLRQLNQFEELKNTRTKELNFELSLQGLKVVNILEIDRDVHNWTINAKYRSLFPPFDEWLTIVCLDGRILVNSRPALATMLFWLRRNALSDFRKFV